MSKQREKYLRKVTAAQKELIYSAINKIVSHDFSGLDIKRLSSHPNMRRCRVGDLRILFYRDHEKVTIRTIRPRGDMYKGGK